MLRPNVTQTLLTGQLNIAAPLDDGVTAIFIAPPAAPTAGYGVPFLIKSKKQAAEAFADPDNADVVAALVNGYFAEAPEGTAVYIICLANSNGLDDLLTTANTDLLLNYAKGAVKLAGVVKFPDVGYTATIANGFDADVHLAVTAANLVTGAWYAKNKPLCILIEGYGMTTIAAAKDYSTADNLGVGVVAYNIDGSTAMATLLTLGRAAAVAANINIGMVEDGSLTIPEASVVKIGANVVDTIAAVDLDTLYGKRYITVEPNQADSGYLHTYDQMACKPTADYNNLRYCRVIFNASRISYQTYYRKLKKNVDVTAGGLLGETAVASLKTEVETNIDAQMRAQLSKKADGTADVQCLVNPDPKAYIALYENAGIESPNFNLLQTGDTYLFVLVRPQGSLDYISVYLGYQGS